MCIINNDFILIIFSIFQEEDYVQGRMVRGTFLLLWVLNFRFKNHKLLWGFLFLVTPWLCLVWCQSFMQQEINLNKKNIVIICPKHFFNHNCSASFSDVPSTMMVPKMSIDSFFFAKIGLPLLPNCRKSSWLEKS